ncbi:hypothetical protein Mapa_016401 [Marchantia paleacea]|nr:hypothetical protein Mapa_016401 [Marchantia paleacea]
MHQMLSDQLRNTEFPRSAQKPSSTANDIQERVERKSAKSQSSDDRETVGVIVGMQKSAQYSVQTTSSFPAVQYMQLACLSSANSALLTAATTAISSRHFANGVEVRRI